MAHRHPEPIVTPPDAAEMARRLASVRRQMASADLDAFVAHCPDNVFYLTNFANYVHERPFVLVVPAEGALRFVVPELEEEHVRIRAVGDLELVHYFEFPAPAGEAWVRPPARCARRCEAGRCRVDLPAAGLRRDRRGARPARRDRRRADDQDRLRDRPSRARREHRQPGPRDARGRREARRDDRRPLRFGDTRDDRHDAARHAEREHAGVELRRARPAAEHLARPAQLHRRVLPASSRGGPHVLGDQQPRERLWRRDRTQLLPEHGARGREVTVRVDDGGSAHRVRAHGAGRVDGRGRPGPYASSSRRTATATGCSTAPATASA